MSGVLGTKGLQSVVVVVVVVGGSSSIFVFRTFCILLGVYNVCASACSTFSHKLGF